MISWVYDPMTFQTRAENIGEVQAEGVEFELEQKLGEKGKGYVNYTYQRAINKKLAVDKTIPYTPQTKYNAGIMFEDAAVLVRNVGTRYIDSQNTISLPGYTVVDMRISRKIGKTTVELSVNNLFDERYSEAMGLDLSFNLRGYPMPGRSYLLGMKWEF